MSTEHYIQKFGSIGPSQNNINVIFKNLGVLSRRSQNNIVNFDTHKSGFALDNLS